MQTVCECLPGVGSGREQVDCFDEQLEVFLVPALPPAASSSAGLVGAASRLPRLDLGFLLPLQLGVHLLHLREEHRCVCALHIDQLVKKGCCGLSCVSISCQISVKGFTCFSTAVLLSSFEPEARISFRACRLETVEHHKILLHISGLFHEALEGFYNYSRTNIIEI